MDENPIKVAAAQVRRTIRQAIRTITGETGSQADGTAKKAAGNAESGAGDTGDTKDAASTKPSK